MNSWDSVCLIIIIDFNKEIFNKNFSYLKNNVYEIAPSKKALYHALCVTSGNFSQLLWFECEKLLKDIELPKKILAPYLHKCVDNFCTQEKYLTGPLVRKDTETIQKNLASLEKSSPRLKEVYDKFYKFYENEELKWVLQYLSKKN